MTLPRLLVAYLLLLAVDGVAPLVVDILRGSLGTASPSTRLLASLLPNDMWLLRHGFLVATLVRVALAMLVVAAWHRSSRTETSSLTILRSAHTIARWSLAAVIVAAGMAILISGQPLAPDDAVLRQPLGMLSGREFMWAAFGTMPVYATSLGVALVGNALLLLFRRTATAGAALAVSFIAYAAVLLFGFGTPDRSAGNDAWRIAELLVPALFLIGADWPRLVDVQFRRRPTVAIEHVPILAPVRSVAAGDRLRARLDRLRPSPFMEAVGIRWALGYTITMMLSRALPVRWTFTGLPQALRTLDQAVASMVGGTVAAEYGGVVPIVNHMVLALVVALVWASLDRRRRFEHWIRESFVLCARLSLFVMLLGYGAAQKIAANYAIGPVEIATPFGEIPDLTFLWLGYSISFNVFAAFAELIGGVLILYRPTMTLGGLLIAGALGNVFLLTVDTWDLSGAMTAGAYVPAAFALAMLDLRRIVDALLLGRATNPEPERVPAVAPRWQLASGFAVLALLAWNPLLRMYRNWRYSDYASPLAGIYDAVDARGTALAWRSLAVDDYFQIVNLRTRDDRSASFFVLPRYKFEKFPEMSRVTAADTGTFLLTRWRDSAMVFPDTMHAHWERIAPNRLRLAVAAPSDSFAVELERRSWSQYRFLNPHWPRTCGRGDEKPWPCLYERE